MQTTQMIAAIDEEITRLTRVKELLAGNVTGNNILAESSPSTDDGGVR